MPEVLSGSQPGLQLSALHQAMADLLGESTNSDRFKNMVTRWGNDGIREVQLRRGGIRRTTVYNAAFNTIADTAEYDVRRSEDDGGFGWDNCAEVRALVVPTISSRPLEVLKLDQWRNRSYEAALSGPPVAWVTLDQYRVLIVPTPDIAYAGVGDYFQDIPQVTENDGRVDWPKAWDTAILHYCMWRADKWREPGAVAANESSRRLFERTLAEIAMDDADSPALPKRAVVTRRLKTRRLFHDNSTDVR